MKGKNTLRGVDKRKYILNDEVISLAPKLLNIITPFVVLRSS